MTVGFDRSRLAALIDGKDRALLAAFLRDQETDFVLHSFPSTTAGEARLTCAWLAFEYPILGIHSAGLSCLMEALAQLPKATPLTRYIRNPLRIPASCSRPPRRPVSVRTSTEGRSSALSRPIALAQIGTPQALGDQAEQLDLFIDVA